MLRLKLIYVSKRGTWRSQTHQFLYSWCIHLLMAIICKGVWEKSWALIALNNTSVCQGITTWVHVVSTHFIVGGNKHSLLNIRHASPNIMQLVFSKVLAYPLQTLPVKARYWLCFVCSKSVKLQDDMMTSCHGNIFCITGHLWRKPLVNDGFSSLQASNVYIA